MSIEQAHAFCKFVNENTSVQGTIREAASDELTDFELDALSAAAEKEGGEADSDKKKKEVVIPWHVRVGRVWAVGLRAHLRGTHTGNARAVR